MPAHLYPLPKCDKCKKPATHKLRNTYNATCGYYCERCGPKALKEFKERHEGANTSS